MAALRCFLCEEQRKYLIEFRKLSDYLGHIRLFHAHQPNFKIDCGLNGCRRSFVKLHTFRKHISDWHSGDPNLSNYSSNDADRAQHSVLLSPDENHHEGYHSGPNEDHDNVDDDIDDEELHTDNAATMQQSPSPSMILSYNSQIA